MTMNIYGKMQIVNNFYRSNFETHKIQTEDEIKLI